MSKRKRYNLERVTWLDHHGVYSEAYLTPGTEHLRLVARIMVGWVVEETDEVLVIAGTNYLQSDPAPVPDRHRGGERVTHPNADGMPETRTCGRCDGERVVWVKDDDAQPGEPQHFPIDCPTCHGLGVVTVPILIPEFIDWRGRKKRDREESSTTSPVRW